MPFCLVQGLINYCHLRGVQPGLLFCHQNLESITVYQFNTELSRCLTFCGLDTKKYKGHSFRIGAASHATDKGFSDAQIRSSVMGCHWTPSFYFSTTLRSTILLFPPLEPKVRHGAAFALYFMLFYATWVTEKYKGTRKYKCIYNTTLCIIQ